MNHPISDEPDPNVNPTDLTANVLPLALFETLERCDICGSSAHRTILVEENNLNTDAAILRPYARSKVYLRECDNCKFAFVGKLPAHPGFYKELYSTIVPDFDTEFNFHGKRSINHQARRAIERFQRCGQLLDVGAWAGAFLHSMSDRFQGEAVEISPLGAECIRKAGFKVQCAQFLDAELKDAYYDVISFIDVLEHLPSPGKVLDKTRRLLKPNGIVYIKVPNYIGQMNKQSLLKTLRLSNAGIMENYVHINHFTTASLTEALKRSGFEILESGATGAEVWDLRNPRLSFKSKFSKFARNLLANTITSVMNTISKVTGVDWYLNIYVVARKRGAPL